MKILFLVNYYYPYISGVSETLRLLAEHLAKDKSNKITVLCSNHEKLQEYEIINGVEVIRAPIIMKISKGTVSPAFIRRARKLSKQYDVVNIHAPMLESGLLSKIIDNKKLVLTYHCDINLPKSILNNFIVKVMDLSHKIAMKNSRKIVVSSLDYAKKTRFTGKYIQKCVEIAPLFKEKKPVKIKKIENSIGFCGRIVEEKGINILIKAFEIVQKQKKDAKLIIAGDYKNIAGGSVYPSLKNYIDEKSIKNVEFLGKVPESDLEKFYSKIQVFVLPSINSLEAFGLVQLEAMCCGTPVIASNLPGVRTIVKNTKMGLIAKVGDYEDLAKKIIELLDNKEKFILSRKEILNIYSNNILANKY